MTITVIASSCLKSGLDTLPAFSDAKIDRFDFEYRWVNSKGSFSVQTLTTNSVVSNDTVKISISVPAPSSTFPEAERPKVSLSNIVAYCNISTAAKMEPVSGSPRLGVPADFTNGPFKYKVTAADGSSKIWTVVVAPLPVINKYEGTYTANGYFYHPSSPRDIAGMNKYLSSSDANSVTVELGDLGGSGYFALLTVNSDNSLTITPAPGAAGAPYTMFTSGLPTSNPGYTAQWSGSSSCNNRYDPATKTFYVRYGYLGGTGWRVTEEKIVKQ